MPRSDWALLTDPALQGHLVANIVQLVGRRLEVCPLRKLTYTYAGQLYVEVKREKAPGEETVLLYGSRLERPQDTHWGTSRRRCSDSVWECRYFGDKPNAHFWPSEPDFPFTHLVPTRFKNSSDLAMVGELAHMARYFPVGIWAIRQFGRKELALASNVAGRWPTIWANQLGLPYGFFEAQ